MKKETDFKRWVYHQTEEPKVILNSQFSDYEDDGWADSPAKFHKIETFGVDAEDPQAVQALGDSIKGVKDRINGELNIGKMDKEELYQHALEHHDVTLNLDEGVRSLRKQVKELAAE